MDIAHASAHPYHQCFGRISVKIFSVSRVAQKTRRRVNISHLIILHSITQFHVPANQSFPHFEGAPGGLFFDNFFPCTHSHQFNLPDMLRDSFNQIPLPTKPKAALPENNPQPKGQRRFQKGRLSPNQVTQKNQNGKSSSSSAAPPAGISGPVNPPLALGLLSFCP